MPTLKIEQNKTTGLTLMETMITVAVFLSVSAILTTIFFSTWGNYYTQESLNKLQLEARQATYRIAKNIRAAESVILSYTQDSQTYQTTAHSLVIKLASIDADQNIIPNHYDYIVYQIESGYPSQQVAAEVVLADALSSRVGAKFILTDKLFALNFTYLDSSGSEILAGNLADATLVKIDLILEEVEHGEEIQTNFSTQTKLRNK